MFGKRSIIGLDIGSSSAKLAEMSVVKGRVVLSQAALIEFDSDRNEDRLRMIKDHVKALQARRCVVGVSGRSVCVRYLPVSAGSRETMMQALNYEADNVIPFELNEVFLDGQNITPFEGLSDEAEIDTVLVAVKKSRVQELIKDVRAAGLVPQIIDVEAFCLGNLFEMQGQDMSFPVALIDVGAFKTTLNIVKDGSSRFSREVYLGGNDLEQSLVEKLGLPEESARRIVRGEMAHEEARNQYDTIYSEMASELLTAFEFFESRSPDSIMTVFITGGGALAPGLIDSLSMQLGRDINIWNPFQGLECEGVDPDELGQDRFRFAVALGLASRTTDPAA